MSANEKHSAVVSFLWDIANQLWGAMTKSEHQNVILPFTVLRRLDYALEPTKAKLLQEAERMKAQGLENPSDHLCRTTGYAFYNTSPFTFDTLLDEGPTHLDRNLRQYINGFSENVQEIFRKFRFDDVIRNLVEVDRLFVVMSKFNEKSKLNLRPYDAKTNPAGLTNHDMGMVFEQLIRRYNEDINENPGEHYTPRDIIRLLVSLVISLDQSLRTSSNPPRTVSDCCSGTGGMLSVGREEILRVNPKAKVQLFGQELNPRTWAVCLSDMLLMTPERGFFYDIRLGSTLSNDAHADRRHDYQFANPPYGFEWKVDREAVEREAERKSYGRFGVGLPRISDGQLLFLQHMVWHMNPNDPSYVGIVFNGSPLFTGDAGSGESEIRRSILERDLLHALVALPVQMFYNTPIQTYLWILCNRKPTKMRGKVMLLDCSGDEFWTELPKSVGAKRRTISDEQRATILKLFKTAEAGEHVKIFDSRDFGYRRIQVERPLRLNFQPSPERLALLRESATFQNLARSDKRREEDRKSDEAAGRKLQKDILRSLETLPGDLLKDRSIYQGRLDAALASAGLALKKPVLKAILAALGERDETAEICRDTNGDPEPDSELRDYENVPLHEKIEDYFDREVRPHVPDAWINEEFTDEQDGKVGKVGYEINFNRFFYRYTPPRAPEAIDADIRTVEKRILDKLKEVMGP
jgi:type I restriction enzyme M protein